MTNTETAVPALRACGVPPVPLASGHLVPGGHVPVAGHFLHEGQMKFCPTCGHVRVPSPSMTTRERDCMLVIQELSAGGVSPSYEMIARELDMKSRSNVSPLVESLERRGYLRREAGPTGARRAITILRRIPVPQDQIDLEEAIVREHAA